MNKHKPSASTDLTDVDEQELFLSKKVQALQTEIDSLKKDMRQNEFQYRQQIVELKNELEREQKRNEEMATEIQMYISNFTNLTEIQNFAQELETKLSEAENIIVQQKEIEVKLRKEISLLEKDVNSHKNQKELPTPKRNRRTSEEPISKLESEKEELEQQLKKLEESAVQIIMEKEKRILELEENIKEIAISDQQSIITQMEQEFQVEREQKEEELQQLKQVIADLNARIESDQLLFEERLFKRENELTEKLLDNMSHHIGAAKTAENDLLSQLTISEEKLKYQEKRIQDSEKYVEQMKDEHQKEFNIQENKLQDLQKKLTAALQQVYKQEKRVEEVFKKQSQMQRDKLKEVNKLTNARDDLLKTNIKLDKDLRKIQEELDQSQKQLEQAYKINEELEQKIYFMNQKVNDKLNEMDNQLQQQKVTYQMEIKRLKEQKESKSEQITESDELFEGKQQGQGGNILQIPDLMSELENLNNSDLDGGLNAVDLNRSNDLEKDTSQQQHSPKNLLQSFSSDQKLKRDSSGQVKGEDKNYFTFDVNEFPIKESPRLSNRKMYMLSNIQEENQFIRHELQQIKQENEQEIFKKQTFFFFRDLLQQIDSYEKTIEVLQAEIKNQLKQLQASRKAQLSGGDVGDHIKRERELRSELETLKQHLHKLETHLITAKLHQAEETNFLREELKYAERQTLEAKTLLASTTIEKEYFQFNLKKLQSKLKIQQGDDKKQPTQEIKEQLEKDKQGNIKGKKNNFFDYFYY